MLTTDAEDPQKRPVLETKDGSLNMEPEKHHRSLHFKAIGDFSESVRQKLNSSRLKGDWEARRSRLPM